MLFSFHKKEHPKWMLLVNIIYKLLFSFSSLNSALTNKQAKLTNPLTKSDVVNNLTTTTTNVPLSAAQGKALNDKITPKFYNKYGTGVNLVNYTGSHYTCPNDGYISYYNPNNATDVVVYLVGASNDSPTINIAVHRYDQGAIYVRKGMRVRVSSNNVSLVYYPLGS